MMKPDIGGEAMSKHSPDLPGWLGTARRNRSVEEPLRFSAWETRQGGEWITDPNDPRESITEGSVLAGSRRGRLDENPITEEWELIEALKEQASGDGPQTNSRC